MDQTIRFLNWNPSKILKLSMESPVEKIKLIVAVKDVYEYQDISTLLALFGNFRPSRL